jgi:ABC-2 type transport system ATP-binding protein
MGTPDELKRQISGDSINLGFSDEATAKQALAALEGSSFIKEKHVRDTDLNLYVEHGEENLPLVISTLHQKGILSRTIQLSRPSLDDVFLKLTGRSLRESEMA